MALVRLQIGKCAACGMHGLVEPKDMLTRSGGIGSSYDGQQVTQEVCVTCFDAPAGVESANATHERLDAAEYQVPYR